MLQSPSSFEGEGKWSVQRTFHQFSQLGCAQVLPLKRRTGKNVGTPTGRLKHTDYDCEAAKQVTLALGTQSH